MKKAWYHTGIEARWLGNNRWWGPTLRKKAAAREQKKNPPSLKNNPYIWMEPYSWDIRDHSVELVLYLVSQRNFPRHATSSTASKLDIKC